MSASINTYATPEFNHNFVFDGTSTADCRSSHPLGTVKSPSKATEREGVSPGRKRSKEQAALAKSKAGTVKEGRSRSQAKRSNGKDTSVTLTGPLSEIAYNFPQIKINDVETFAARPKADRLGTSATKDGRIKRPLNAFMLYRKAYQEVARAQCKNETADNQAVSRICGASWSRFESERVRKRFKEFATMETTKHREAHPGYKYVPRKLADDDNHDSHDAWQKTRSEKVASTVSYRITSPEPHPVSMFPVQTKSGLTGADAVKQEIAYGSLSQPRPARESSVSPAYHQPHNVQENASLDEHYFRGIKPIEMVHGLPEMQTTNEPYLALSGLDDGKMSLFDDFIDPRLFSQQATSAQDLRLPTMFQGASGSQWPFDHLYPMETTFLQTMDPVTGHDAYLRGNSPDWHVEDLIHNVDSDAFQEADNWFNQAEDNVV